MDNNKSPNHDQIIFIEKLITEFKAFVRESMQANRHFDSDDHYDFLESALRDFIEIKEDREDVAPEAPPVFKSGDRVVLDYTSPIPATVLEVKGDRAKISPDDSNEIFTVGISDLTAAE